jgi:hypothetical protein
MHLYTRTESPATHRHRRRTRSVTGESSLLEVASIAPLTEDESPPRFAAVKEWQ